MPLRDVPPVELLCRQCSQFPPASRLGAVRNRFAEGYSQGCDITWWHVPPRLTGSDKITHPHKVAADDGASGSLGLDHRETERFPAHRWRNARDGVLQEVRLHSAGASSEEMHVCKTRSASLTFEVRLLASLTGNDERRPNLHGELVPGFE